MAVEDYGAAVYQVALTSLRNIIGQHDLDDVLKSRDRINSTLREMVDLATDPYKALVNNASLYEESPLDRVDLAQTRRLWAIHVESPLLPHAATAMDAKATATTTDSLRLTFIKLSSSGTQKPVSTGRSHDCWSHTAGQPSQAIAPWCGASGR